MTGNDTDGSADSGLEYTAGELRRMDEETARNTLTVTQFERWESIQELHDEAAETEAEFGEQADTVAEVTVSADMESLGVEVDVFGNDLLVHADTEDPEFQRHAETLDEEFGDVDGSNVDGVADERLDRLADHLVEMLDLVIVRWDGTEWDDLTDAQRHSVLGDAREQWGIEGLLLAWADIAASIYEDRDERMERIEKFRDPERRGNR
jgi:hypothetical protein